MATGKFLWQLREHLVYNQENKTKHGNSKPESSISSQIDQSQCAILMDIAVYMTPLARNLRANAAKVNVYRDEPLDFNETLVNGSVLNVTSFNE